MSATTAALVKNRILERGRGWCFSIMHFLDLGSKDAIRQALSRLEKQKIIRRLTTGIYDYPEVDDLLGVIPPDLDKVAQVIAEKNGVSIQPAGAHAANLVGLSTQVPARLIYLTEGPSRKVKIGRQEIVFKKSTNKIMSSAGTKVGLLIQAFKNLGKVNIDKIARKRAKKFLKEFSEEEIRKDIKFAPEWVQKIIFEITEIEP